MFFWQLLASANTRNHLLQKLHHCQHLASLPNLIHLHLFHCRNLALLWNRGHFHPSSNYVQYRPHIHYRRHLTHLNKPERRCSKIPSFCHDPVATERFLNASRIETERRRKQWDDGGRNFVNPYTIQLRRFLICCRALEGQCSPLRTHNGAILSTIPLKIPWSMSYAQQLRFFSPAD